MRFYMLRQCLQFLTTYCRAFERLNGDADSMHITAVFSSSLVSGKEMPLPCTFVRALLFQLARSQINTSESLYLRLKEINV
ncbi:hypothetical protein V5799_030938 [Amblyomma americanum]|uniref:Uncharacterized protein n=1 Tax=Amblyomma americanum TaxID=6943 RepID=A0AAQ4ELY4_AMBAM